jgi:hypothetical protein
MLLSAGEREAALDHLDAAWDVYDPREHEYSD